MLLRRMNQNLLISKRNMKYQFILGLMLAAIVWEACSTKVDGVAYRIYHNTTGHYNGYFNANELIKKTQLNFEVKRKDDFDEVIVLKNYGNPELFKEAKPEMDKAIKKCEKVIKRHTMTSETKKDMKWPVFNKWMDDNYLVIGQANLYKGDYFKAQETFDFISNKYQDPDVVLNAYTWAMRAYMLDSEFSRAKQILLKAEALEDVSEKFKVQFELTKAEFYMAQNMNKEAIENLENAIPRITKKQEKIIPQFALAQLYDEENRSSDAKLAYQKILKLKPDYQLEFHSRLKLLLAEYRTTGNASSTEKALELMLVDEKNESYKSYIFSGLGMVAVDEGRKLDAVGRYNQALKETKDNRKQRTKLFILLADLNFDLKQYTDAQRNYDSAYHNLSDKHPRYSEIKARAQSLLELVTQLRIIDQNDSLVNLCAKNPEEIQMVIEREHDRLTAEMTAQKERDKQELLNRLKGDDIVGTFWIYNKNLLEKGKQSFEDQWGSRPLKDNWRNQSLVSQMFSVPDESIIEMVEDTAQLNNDKYKVPSVEEMKSKLPCADKKSMDKLAADLAEAYYMAGLVYKEKLNDLDNALLSWFNLDQRCVKGSFHAMAYYQLFRGWTTKEKEGYQVNSTCPTCSAAYWGRKIKTEYPGSEWAMLVDDPNYASSEQIRRSEEEKNYTAAYSHFQNGNYVQALLATRKAIEERPDNHLICQYHMLRAYSLSKTEVANGVKENCIAELNWVKTNCPDTDLSKAASDALKAMDGKLEPQPQNNESGQFKRLDEGEHFVVISFENKMGDFKAERTGLADFNSTFFSSNDYKVSKAQIPNGASLVLVKSFSNLKEAKEYFTTFVGDQELSKVIDFKATKQFIITKQNYLELFKSRDLKGYLEFAQKNY